MHYVKYGCTNVCVCVCAWVCRLNGLLLFNSEPSKHLNTRHLIKWTLSVECPPAVSVIKPQ